MHSVYIARPPVFVIIGAFEDEPLNLSICYLQTKIRKSNSKLRKSLKAVHENYNLKYVRI
jgi:hypothetical protein